MTMNNNDTWLDELCKVCEQAQAEKERDKDGADAHHHRAVFLQTAWAAMPLLVDRLRIATEALEKISATNVHISEYTGELKAVIEAAGDALAAIRSAAEGGGA